MREITPTETYLLRGREVHVKRDDLMGDNIEYPAWVNSQESEMFYVPKSQRKDLWFIWVCLVLLVVGLWPNSVPKKI